jgi:hypothetical protein
MPELRDDICNGVEEIAHHIKQSKRRTLYLIEAHGLPVFKIGRNYHARKHKLDAYIGGAATQPAADQGAA